MPLPPNRDDGIISDPDEVIFPDEPVILTSPQTLSDPEAPLLEGTDTTSEASAGESSEEPPPEFDPKHRLDFEGLLYLGYLTDEFVWMGHKFKIRTITTNEYLEISLLHRNYRDTIGDVRAYTTAVVAACLEQADGKDLPLPLERTVRDNSLSYRFTYISEHWYPWIIDAIYERFQLLEARVDAALTALGKASG